MEEVGIVHSSSPHCHPKCTSQVEYDLIGKFLSMFVLVSFDGLAGEIFFEETQFFLFACF